ncbi:MAG: 50S ribosomal protein L29 [Acidithiobacillus caldus]|uniref:50S ribosomal protein L29 n=1 Tax=Acidithiobacillus caldus TaxID=33059 RepID=UPI001C07E5EE|nr:50S ribosomal protein L29 [Acidithiobacillus caldus]MBU2790214.1 50S ribosomal protein L29 [Acidithiobacillus caldus]MBU2820557.1 50S ribosomal protein L29 [Acidithiobacillus caldus]WMT46682.1 MAG: 50S ribosomal protein L29 [Acidithiobacillus caldus]
MKQSELHGMSLAECRQRLDQLLEEQFKLRMQHGTGQLGNTARLRGVRRDIARVRTAMTAKARSEG